MLGSALSKGTSAQGGFYTNTVPQVTNSDFSVSLFCRPLGAGINGGANACFSYAGVTYGGNIFSAAHNIYFIDQAGAGCQPSYASEGGSGFLLSGPTVPYGAWYHIGVSISGNSGIAIFYWKPVGTGAHNVLSHSVNVTNFNPSSAGVIQILDDWDGSAGDSDAIFGCVCGVRFWCQVKLTDEDFYKESMSINPVRTADLYYHWPLTSNTGVSDRSNRQNTLTIGDGSVLSTGNGPPVMWKRPHNFTIPPPILVPTNTLIDPIFFGMI